MAATVDSNSPVPHEKLEQYASSACESAFGSVSDYDHDSAEKWNHSIINAFLKHLVDSNTDASDGNPPKRFKYAVTSTIIQHLDSPSTASTGTSTDTEEPSTVETNGTSQRPTSGRRGMHSATGAYWNNETDGMWTYKWEAAETKGCDVVLSVIWVLA